VLLADGTRGRIYQARAPQLATARLETIYEQRQFSRRADAAPDEEESFARELCRVLERMVATAQAENLFLAAPPAFLAHLRRHLGPLSTSRLAGVLDEDLFACAPDVIVARFAQLRRRVS